MPGYGECLSLIIAIMSRPRYTPLILAVVTALFGSACPSAQALLVDWDTLTWAPGSLSNSYDIDAGTPGNDVTITVSGQASALTNDSTTGIMTPNIGTSITGGLSPVQSSFEIAGNLHTNSKITLTVGFNPLYNLGVRNVSFSIFDIDLGTNKDQIKSIYGIALDGTHVAATITNLGSVVTLTGSGLAQALAGNAASPNSGAGSANGNATISFGSTAITGFSFVFANNAGAPRYQDIAVGDIFFTPIPEVDPAVPAIILCAVAVLFAHLRKRRV